MSKVSGAAIVGGEGVTLSPPQPHTPSPSSPSSQQPKHHLLGVHHHQQQPPYPNQGVSSLSVTTTSLSPPSAPVIVELVGSSRHLSDDEVVFDERKQKRMLSNRESARRSRLRKQQHLDDLKQEVTSLRSANTEMTGRFSMAARQYAYLTEENRLLRSHAMELSQTLHRLHQAAGPTVTGLYHPHSMGLTR